MTPAEAAWVREHVWPKAMSGSLAPIDVCPCQYGPTSWCLHGACHQCKAHTVAYAETYITDLSGLVLHAREYRGGHPALWLADGVCRWICPCACHASPEPQAEQLGLFSEAAA